ncbi:DUF732 domain-containing protein [Mycobacterium servetii]|uniref:DUF732 domain-containing protein n=1 Tax=Mycobacterium servetii TaxID=3237418 RepID=A0ABV4C4A7_9MYCO
MPDPQDRERDGSPSGSSPRGSAPCYLPNVIAAIAASVGIVVGSAGPWASRAWIAANGAPAGIWWQGQTTFALAAVAGAALFILLHRVRIGSGTRWLLALAWLAPGAGLVCLLIAMVNIVNVTSAADRLVGLHVGWGLWLVAISAVVLCAMASVAAAQVGAVIRGSRAGVHAAIAISVPILLGVALYVPIRWAAVSPHPGRDPQPPISAPVPVLSPQSPPSTAIPATVAPQSPEIAEVQQLWLTALQKHHPVQDFLAAVQAAGVTGLEPALLNNGYRVCGELWNGGMDGVQAAKDLQKRYPTLTLKQAAQFVLAAAENLCPTSAYAGVYNWWESGGGAGAGGGGGAAGGGGG